MIILRIFNSRISSVYQFSEINEDSSREDKIKKCREIIFYFEKIFRNPNLKKSMETKKNIELNNISNNFYTDMEFFLKPYRNKNII